MKVPCHRVYCVGYLSPWATQFLQALQQNNIVEVHHEKQLEAFISTQPNQFEVPLVFLENGPESHRTIEQLRKSNRACYIVWFGRGFSREDMLFAIEHRIYWVLDHPRGEDEKVHRVIGDVAARIGEQEEIDQMMRSFKSVSLQEDAEPSLVPQMQEFGHIISKLETAGLYNEFRMTQPSSEPSELGNTVPVGESLSSVIDSIHNLERTGFLYVRGTLQGESGRLDFLQGKLIQAETGQVSGAKAVYRMFLWDGCQFSFVRKPPSELSNSERINIAVKYLLEEGQALKRRYDKIRRELPPLEIELELEDKALHTGTQLHPREFSALTSIVEFGKVQKVLDYNEMSDVVIYESLIQLRRNHLIRVAG